MFCFSFEYSPPREAPSPEHQTVSLDHFAETGISCKEIFTNKGQPFLPLQLVSVANSYYELLLSEIHADVADASFERLTWYALPHFSLGRGEENRGMERCQESTWSPGYKEILIVCEIPSHSQITVHCHALLEQSKTSCKTRWQVSLYHIISYHFLSPPASLHKNNV